MPTLPRLVVGIFVLAALQGCRERAFKPVPAPPFSLKDLSGKTVSLAAYKGHPVLLDFWATWCVPCQISIPMVQRFYQNHKDQGLVVVGVNVDDDPSGVEAFAKHFGLTYPVVLAGGTAVSEDYQVEGIPLFIFIDKNGQIVKRFEGFRRDMYEIWEYEFQHMSAPQ